MSTPDIIHSGIIAYARKSVFQNRKDLKCEHWHRLSLMIEI